MSITDELREWWVREFPIMGKELHKDFTAIADRIDAEHEKRIASVMNDALYHANEKDMADLGWVRGPLDADGVMWHEGDMSDSVWGEIELIMRDIDGNWYIKGHDTSAPWVRADSMRHHHEPTVEDVLDEFASAYDRIGSYDEEQQKYLDLIAEYAAKLQLRGNAE